MCTLGALGLTALVSHLIRHGVSQLARTHFQEYPRAPSSSGVRCKHPRHNQRVTPWWKKKLTIANVAGHRGYGETTFAFSAVFVYPPEWVL